MGFLETIQQIGYTLNPEKAAEKMELHRYHAKLAEMEYRDKRREFLPPLRRLKFDPKVVVRCKKCGFEKTLDRTEKFKLRRKMGKELCLIRDIYLGELKEVEKIKSSRALIGGYVNEMCTPTSP